MKLIIRLFAFFGKELNEVRRQPRLLLSLLVGPFLILLLFGLGYSDQRPTLRIALVMPEELEGDPRGDRVQQVLADNFDLVYTGSDPEPAMQLLENEQVDLVEIMPADYQERIDAGQQAPFQFIYNEINPQEEQYLQYSAFTQVDALNQVFVTESVQQLQQESQSVSQDLDQLRTALDALERNPDEAQDDEETQQSVREMSATLALLAASPALAMSGGQGSETSAELMQLSEDLDELDQAMEENRIDDQRSEIPEMRRRLDELDGTITELGSTPAGVLAAPLQQQTENLQGRSLEIMKYFAPGVSVLILQHIAVTLGALSLVRERYRGAFEFFGVAPVSLLQVLFGKYLAYLVYVGVIAGALVALMVWPLQVPFLGNPWIFAGFAALFVVASIGIGFVISVISDSDTQAVQLAMLVLLLSIFFSGFILPLENFTVPVKYVGYIAPMTHAMVGFQDVMLMGQAPGSFQWIALAVLAILAFILLLVFGYPQFRRPLS